jgi:hypothetical protein
MSDKVTSPASGRKRGQGEGSSHAAVRHKMRRPKPRGPSNQYRLNGGITKLDRRRN